MDNEDRIIEELPLPELDYSDPPVGSDRRAFMIRSALATAITMLTGAPLVSLVMYVSENGDGDSHARKNMPVLLAGHAGGFKTGRSVAASNQVTGALHASIIQRFGLEVASYGSPGGKPIAEL